MPTSEQFSALVRAHQRRDDPGFRRVVSLVAADERGKGRTKLADELDRLLNITRPQLAAPPADRDGANPLARLAPTTRRLADLSLRRATRDALTSLVEEMAHADALDAADVPLRRTALLYGPPGCGKTSVAAALAAELDRPFAVAKADGLLSSYLGSSSKNLSKLFEWVADNDLVLLIDEFDSLGQDRGLKDDVGELRRVVNALLQEIESYAGRSLVIAATNHQDILDSALWRRFDVVAELPLPTLDELASIIAALGDVDATAVASEFEGLPHAAAEYFVHAARRRAIVAGHTTVTDEDLDTARTLTLDRRWV